MISQFSIVKNTSTFPNKMFHITFECVVHLHGHWSKVEPLIKSSILANFNNGVKFHSYTYWLINDIQSHRLLHWVSNHHINNKDLVLLGHVKIGS
jgi:hypothetical protein